MIAFERHLGLAWLGLRAGRGTHGAAVIRVMHVRPGLHIVADVLAENVQIATVKLLDSATNAHLCKQSIIHEFHLAYAFGVGVWDISGPCM